MTPDSPQDLKKDDELELIEPEVEELVVKEPVEVYKDKTDWTIDKPIMPRDFDEDEIKEINQYITANVPYSILQQTLPITDNPLQKAKVYTITYRFINGAKNYVQKEETRKKLLRLLDEHNELYAIVNAIILDIDEAKPSFSYPIKYQKLLGIYKDFKKNMMVSNFIDIFLVFAEKQNLVHIDRVTGLNLETEEGKDAYDKLMEDEF